MPHSYCSNFVHAVFSTKERRPLIKQELQDPLWKYMIGTGKNLGIDVLSVGGVDNHSHVLLSLPSTMSIATAIQKIKANSSRWMSNEVPRFEWQQGYHVVSVCPSQVPRVKRYIANQQEHHKKVTFEEEFLKLLKACGVDYDPKFVFG